MFHHGHLFLATPPDPLSLTLIDTTIAQCTVVKLLGVYIQSDLKWQTHVNSMIKRANSCLFMLRKLKYHYLNTSDLVSIYISFVRPILEYAAPAWSGEISSKQCNDLERVQKRTCKIILADNYKRYSDTLQACNIETQQCRRKHMCQSFAKTLPESVLQGILPRKSEFWVPTEEIRTSGWIPLQNWTLQKKPSPSPHPSLE